MPESPCRRARCLYLAFVAQRKGESNSDDERNGKEHEEVIFVSETKIHRSERPVQPSFRVGVTWWTPRVSYESAMRPGRGNISSLQAGAPL